VGARSGLSALDRQADSGNREGTVALADFERKSAESLIDFIENFLCDLAIFCQCDIAPAANFPPPFFVHDGEGSKSPNRRLTYS
jgi:hypothetical protein